MLGRGPVAPDWALQCGLLAPVSGKVIRQARNRSLIRRDVTAAEIIAIAAERWMRTTPDWPFSRNFLGMGATGLEPVTPSLSRRTTG